MTVYFLLGLSTFQSKIGTVLTVWYIFSPHLNINATKMNKPIYQNNKILFSINAREKPKRQWIIGMIKKK